jgi:RimJ/RimL family protein N-acetyltransferase
MVRIETERLIIRQFQEKDAAGLLDYLLHPRVNCFLDEKLNTFEDAVAAVKQRSQDPTQLAVCLKENDAIIGNLFAMKEEPDTYSVGWQFNEKIEGKGYANESAKAFLNYLFHKKSGRRIYAYVEEDNIRSQKLCERLGMRKEACFVEFISFTNYPDGTPKYENTFQYAVLKREWEVICR